MTSTLKIQGMSCEHSAGKVKSAPEGISAVTRTTVSLETQSATVELPGGVKRMINEDRYCVDILTQTAAMTAAMSTIEGIVMKNHLNTCVADVMRSQDLQEQRAKVDEVMTVIGRFSKVG